MANAPKHIHFVCTGNICRSPMAEGIFRHLVRGRNGITVSSSGVGAVYGQQPSAYAVEVLKKKGIDISRQRSQPISRQIVDRATYIFCMTHGHLSALQMNFPQSVEKTFLVGEFANSEDGFPDDVPDPIGQEIEVYRDCAEMLEKALPAILAFIEKNDQQISQTNL